MYERILNEIRYIFSIEHCNVENLLYNYWAEGKKLILENPGNMFLEIKQLMVSNM